MTLLFGLDRDETVVMSGWAVRTKPQAPRTLDCAIYWGHGPDKIASSALPQKVLTY
jgi:hypothetical protein